MPDDVPGKPGDAEPGDPSNLDDIVVVLSSMMGGEEFDLAAPPDVTIGAILLEVLENEACPFRRRDDANREIQYTLIWVEGNNRALQNADTLGELGVRSGNHLVLRQEARAGQSDAAAAG